MVRIKNDPVKRFNTVVGHPISSICLVFADNYNIRGFGTGDPHRTVIVCLT